MFSHGENMFCKISKPFFSILYYSWEVTRVKTWQEINPFLEYPPAVVICSELICWWSVAAVVQLNFPTWIITDICLSEVLRDSSDRAMNDFVQNNLDLSQYKSSFHLILTAVLSLLFSFPFCFHTGDRGEGVIGKGHPWCLQLLLCDFSEGHQVNAQDRGADSDSEWVSLTSRSRCLFVEGYSLVIHLYT